MNPFAKLTLALILGLSSTAFALANEAQHGHHGHAANQSPEAAASMSEGEVRKVDKDAGKMTIKHGELKNLEMPPMTMVFRVADPAMLDQVKTGDKIHFVADKAGGQFRVIQVEVQK